MPRFDLSACMKNCSNNGFCQFLNESFVCNCTQNFTGKSCEQDRRLCSVNFQCVWGGNCTDIIDGELYDYECKCEYPYYGRYFNQKTIL